MNNDQAGQDETARAVSGLLSHVDMCIGNPARSIPFYDTLLTALGYVRWRYGEEWQEPDPVRGTWGKRIAGDNWFGVDLRPVSDDAATSRHDRYGPGMHHLAFHAATRGDVDRIHRIMLESKAIILDPPADYGGRPGYGDDYYALFVEDPDGVKLEVVCAPGFGPPADAGAG